MFRVAYKLHGNLGALQTKIVKKIAKKEEKHVQLYFCLS